MKSGNCFSHFKEHTSITQFRKQTHILSKTRTELVVDIVYIINMWKRLQGYIVNQSVMISR